MLKILGVDPFKLVVFDALALIGPFKIQTYTRDCFKLLACHLKKGCRLRCS